ncbi:MAG: cell division protein FtsQ/DivIB, partial [Polyangia bacterium]
MLPKARSRSARRSRWSIFGRRGNRRVRSSSPALPRPPRPPLWASAWGALVSWRRSLLVAGVGVALAAGAWAGRWYVTHARHFAVRTVHVSATAHVSADAIVARAQVPLGINLFAVDRAEVARAVSQEPWVARAHVRRELPSTLMIDVVEREAVITVAFGALYLADGEGNVFKRATPEEAVSLPVVTGLLREDYVSQPERAREQLRQALQAVAVWRAKSDRPPLGEIHVDRIAGVTVYTDRGVGVRLGVVDDTLPVRLARFD